jgi:hypothetical protein
MKKLSLRVEELAVESFDTTSAHRIRQGTVHAASVSEDTTCESEALTFCGSCGYSHCLDPSCGPPCEPTFAYSCGGTCIDETCDINCPPSGELGC